MKNNLTTVHDVKTAAMRICICVLGVSVFPNVCHFPRVFAWSTAGLHLTELLLFYVLFVMGLVACMVMC